MYTTKIVLLNVNDLFVDPYVQRSISASRVKKMASKWDSSLCGVLAVSARAGGIYAILDGQHRYEAGKAAGATEFRCEVFVGLTTEEEIQYHEDTQGSRKPDSALDGWILSGNKGGPQRELDKMLEKVNLVVGKKPLNAVASLEKVLAAHGVDGSFEIINAIKAAFNTPTPFKMEMIDGFSQFHTRFPEISLTELSAKVNKELNGSETRFLDMVDKRAQAAGRRGHGLGTFAVPVLANIWNRNKKKIESMVKLGEIYEDKLSSQ